MAAKEDLKNRKRSGNSRIWRWSRQAVQVLALLLFLYLLLGTRQEGTTLLPLDLFFRLDPLAGITTMLAGRNWLAPLALGGVTLLLTLVLGRVWCGWICPLGTILDWTPARHPRRNSSDIPGYWRHAKHFLLFTTLLAAMLGSLTLLVLDPITLLFRTVANLVLPAFSFLVTAMETWLYKVSLLRPALEWFDNLVRGSLLTEQPFFWPSLLLGLVFAGVLALNAIRPRFWCRYLCPLASLLGLVSRIAPVRYAVDEAKCTACRRCAVACPTGAIDPEQKFAASAAECTVCLDCVEVCPTAAITFRGQWSLTASQGYQPARRQFLFSLVPAIVGALLLRTMPNFHQTNPLLIRPPGTSEEELLSKCIRCAECIRVCPTGGLQPSLTTAGWDGLWTPVLVSRHGYCDYSCTSCGEVCPTGAIPELSLPVKRWEVLGLAVIDEERCLPFAEATPCIVCEEVCPVPYKAVWLKETVVFDDYGQPVDVDQPRVIRSLCIGCGICEYQCPVEGESAIRMYRVDAVIPPVPPASTRYPPGEKP